jgi:hypothetical protein
MKHSGGFYVREPVSVLIGEELPDEAWTTAVAAPGQVPEEQWLELIGLREPGDPADVIGPLRDLIELGIERTSDKYRNPKAIKALKRLRDDYQRAGWHLGSFRQAFSHLALINACVHLIREDERIAVG